MARHLPLQNLSFLPVPVIALVTLIAILSVVAIVWLLCGHDHHNQSKQSKIRKRSAATAQLGEKRALSKLQSSISNKAMVMAKMISWRKVQHEGGEDGEEGSNCFDDDDEEVVWKRTIIKGGRCRPLDFSGKILYDDNGNLLPDSPPPATSATNKVSPNNS